MNLLDNVRLPILFRFMAVGVMGICINEGVLIATKGYVGLPLPIAGILAFESAMVCQFQINDRWTFAGQPHSFSQGKRFLSYQIVSLGGLVINDGVLNGLVLVAAIDYKLANLIGIFVAFGWNYTMNCNVTWKPH